MNKYLLVCKLSFQNIFEYRFDFFTQMVKYTFVIVMMAFVWIAVSKENSALHLTPESMIIYFTIAAIVYNLSNFHLDYVEQDIHLGFLSQYLLKPISPFWYYFCYEAIRDLVETVLRLILLFPIFWFFGASIQLTLVNLVIFLLMLPIIFFCAFSLMMIIASFIFWIQDVFAIRLSFQFLARLLSGLLVPISFFPQQVSSFLYYLPFEHFAFTPIQILQGQLSLPKIAGSFEILLLWTVTISLIQQWLWKRGILRYESSGI